LAQKKKISNKIPNRTNLPALEEVTSPIAPLCCALARQTNNVFRYAGLDYVCDFNRKQRHRSETDASVIILLSAAFAALVVYAVVGVSLA
jgi:hypothetical protein